MRLAKIIVRGLRDGAVVVLAIEESGGLLTLRQLGERVGQACDQPPATARERIVLEAGQQNGRVGALIEIEVESP